MKTFQPLFLDWRTGKIGRVGFVAYSAAIWAVLYGLTYLLPSPFSETGSATNPATSAVLPLVVAAAGFVVLAVSLNLAAKRFRDIGLPGWIAIVSVTALNAALLYYAPSVSYPWFSLVVFTGLAVTPSGFLQR